MAVPIIKTLHDWILALCDLVLIDNSLVENQICPWALGRSSGLFAGLLRSGKRAAGIMRLI
jgi:hypothetical protein